MNTLEGKKIYVAGHRGMVGSACVRANYTLGNALATFAACD